MKKSISYILMFSALAILLGSWGATGHRKISTDASLSFNQQMQDFNLWTSFLADHASDADDRKTSDPNEKPKHFIDIDSYYAFLVQGRIPQTLDSMVNLYGNSTVYANGILPYATIATVNLLQQCFEARDLDNAKIVAADLGHYVGDGHMPLHITQNYNGQETGNTGIHSRYESTMIDAYVDQIIYTGDSIAVVPDVTAYVFNYIYKNYTFIDSVLQADTYAHNHAGNIHSPEYTAALWDQTKGFTTQLFKRASHSFCELMYTAWVNAGSPSLTASAIEEYETAHGSYLGTGFPNPFGKSTKIKYSIHENCSVSLQIRDLAGKPIEDLLHEYKTKGSYEMEWVPGNLPAGIYILVMHAGNSVRYRKLVHLN